MFIEALLTPVKYFFVTIGFIRSIKENQYLTALILSSFIFYFAMITGPEGCSRLRLMFEPALIIITAYGIAYLFIYYEKKLCLKNKLL